MKNGAERPKETTNILDNRLVRPRAKKGEGLQADHSDGFSLLSLWPIAVMASMTILLTVCCMWYGPQNVLREILLYCVPPHPDAGHVMTIWFAIVGLLVLAIPESPIIHFLMALPSMLVGFWVGALVVATAEWSGKLLCFVMGRYFAQRPIRQLLMNSQSPRIMRMLSLLEDPDDHSLYLLILWQFLPVGPLRSYGLAVLDVPFSKLAMTSLPQAIAASLLLSTFGMSFKGPLQSLRDEKHIEWMNSSQNIAVVLMVSAAFFVLTWVASRAYQQKAEKNAERESLENAEEGVGDSTQYGTTNGSSYDHFGY